MVDKETLNSFFDGHRRKGYGRLKNTNNGKSSTMNRAFGVERNRWRCLPGGVYDETEKGIRRCGEVEGNRRRSCLRSFFLRHSTNKAHTGGANHSTASM